MEGDKIDASRIDDYMNKVLKHNKIPGCYLFTMHKGQIVCDKGYGISDHSSKKKVTQETYFQLGSTSKAFTALAILQMEMLQKLSRRDLVSKYIPWFNVYYKKEEVEITIENLLYHTSGIPTKTIADIPSAFGNDALEQTVRVLVGQNLVCRPGTKFLYATINYDILGYIIEVITNDSFEKYIKKEIFDSIGLNQEGVGFTYFPRDKIAKGYKKEFLHHVEYAAPIYKGNVPSGYIYLNGIDMSKWIQFQLHPNKTWSNLIEESHKLHENALIKKGAYYAAGWQVEPEKDIISHLGRNPNYVSCIYLKPKENTGVAVMTNTSLTYAKDIGDQVLRILDGKRSKYIFYNNMVLMDIAFTILALSFAGYTVFTLFTLAKAIMQTWCNSEYIFKLIVSCVGISASYYCVKKLADKNKGIIKIKDFIKVWAPKSVYSSFLMFFICVWLTLLFLIIE